MARKTTSSRIEKKDHFINALDPGIRLHLLEKRPRGLSKCDPSNTLLMIHGQSTPAPVAFDFPLPGYSWMDHVASRGFNVFALSVRGYGLSTRPPELLENRLKNPPAVRGRTALRDIEAAVEFICDQKNLDRLNLLGWSWGSTTSPAYTAGHPNRIVRLVLYAPFYAYDRPEVAAESEDPRFPGRIDPRFGAWRWVTERAQENRWGGSIPKGQHSKWREARAAKAYWTAQLQYEHEGKKRHVPGVRIPNGPIADRYDRARNKPLYDASKITCPVLLVRGDHDRSCNDPEVDGLYRSLINSRGKRNVLLGDGTHFMHFERRRSELFQQAQIFLEG